MRQPTDFQQRLLERIAEGDTDHEIAAALGCAVEEVPSAVNALLAELDARTPEHAVAIGFRTGLLVADVAPPVAPA